MYWMVWKIDGKNDCGRHITHRTFGWTFFWFFFLAPNLVSVIHALLEIPMTMNRLRQLEKQKRTRKIRWTIRNCCQLWFNKLTFCTTQIRKFVAIWMTQKVSLWMPILRVLQDNNNNNNKMKATLRISQLHRTKRKFATSLAIHSLFKMPSIWYMFEQQRTAHTYTETIYRNAKFIC